MARANRDAFKPDGRLQALAWTALIVAVTLLAYVPALRAGYVWDDDNYVTNNPALRSLDGLRRIWTTIGATAQYYPLVFTSFWVEYHLWGLRPFGYHLVNVMLHIASALVLWRLLIALGVKGALLAAALFALHPVQVESVAWVTERKNVLSGLFYLLSMAAYLRWLGVMDSGAIVRGRWRSFAAALLLFCAALLSKTVTCTLPAAALVIAWWKCGRIQRWQFVSAVGLLAIGAALASVTVYVERVVVGTAEQGTGLTFAQRLGVAGRAFWFYLGKVLWPAELTFIYPKWKIQGEAWIGTIAVAAFALTVAGTWLLRRRVGRGPLCLVLLYAGTLSPALGFVDVFPFEYSFVADHFQYLATIAPLCGIGYLLQRGAAVMQAPRLARIAAGCTLLVVLAILTHTQARIYHSEETLWRDTIAKNPSALMARSNLGQLLMRNKHALDAETQFREALKVDPEYPIAHFNLGALLLQTDRTSEGMKHLETAAQLDNDNARMHYHIGLAFQRHGELDRAVEQFRKASEMKRGYADPLNDWGNLLARQGELDAAAEKYRAVITMKPEYAPAHANLANVLAQLGDSGRAEPHYKRALMLDPRNASSHFNYATWLEKQGRPEMAQQHFRAAEQLRSK